MYEIHHRRSISSEDDFVLIAKGVRTLAEAQLLRAVSGDLVVDRDTRKIVLSDEWLFGWEKADPRCYAQRAIEFQLSQ